MSGAPQLSPVRYLTADHPSLAPNASARIQERQNELLYELCYAQSWDDYCKRVGTISGLTQALEIIAQVEKDLNEKGR